MAKDLQSLIADKLNQQGFLEPAVTAQELLSITIESYDILIALDNNEAKFLCLSAGMSLALQLGFKLGKER